MKVADVNLFWTRSVSDKVLSQTVIVTVDGEEKIHSTVPPEIETVSIRVKALQTVQFKVLTEDEDGVTESELYTFRTSNLDAPLPATNLGHTVVAIRDVPDEEIPDVPPVAEPADPDAF